MKKIVFFLFLLNTIQSHSQLLKNKFTVVNNNHFVLQLKKNNKFTAGFINNIRPAIWKKFTNMFKSPTDVRWYIDEKEITAYFICDSENVMVKYRNNGSLIWIRKVYEGNNLDTLIASFINQEIEKRFVVNLVTEMIIDEQTFYEISLQHEKECCFLRILRDNEQNELKLIDKTFFKKID